MILYHGTANRHLPSILKNGLLPRVQSGMASNWDGEIESKPNLVYLTTAYPVYFALAACTEEGDDPVVLKVKVKKSELFPDEDFVARMAQDEAKMSGREPLPLKSYNKGIDPLDYKALAETSLKFNGIVSILRVGPKQILGHVELKQDYKLLWLGGDAAPIPQNYGILGPQYVRYVKEIFTNGLDAAFALARKDHDERFRGIISTNKLDQLVAQAGMQQAGMKV